MKRKGTFWILLGLLMIAAALFLTGRNLSENIAARDTSLEAVTHLTQQISTVSHSSEPSSDADLTVFPLGSLLPDHVRNPDMEMPVETVGEYEYIGVLTIPALELDLPVISQWSYPKLKVAPCRYAGSAYKNDLILLAHNYPSHFGNLKNLHTGDSIIFTDMDGNVFTYSVVELEVLPPSAVEEMESGDWDLTLFTCTTGGQSRITVRCVLKDS